MPKEVGSFVQSFLFVALFVAARFATATDEELRKIPEQDPNPRLPGR